MSGSLQKLIGVCRSDYRSLQKMLSRASIGHILANYPREAIGPDDKKQVKLDSRYKDYSSISPIANAKRFHLITVMQEENLGNFLEPDKELSPKERELLEEKLDYAVLTMGDPTAPL